MKVRVEKNEYYESGYHDNISFSIDRQPFQYKKKIIFLSLWIFEIENSSPLIILNIIIRTYSCIEWYKSNPPHPQSIISWLSFTYPLLS